jgi:hypothetical protein
VVSEYDRAPFEAADELARLRAENAALREALQRIVVTYDEYRGRGVMPAPREYRDVVIAIDAARDALASAGSEKERER